MNSKLETLEAQAMQLSPADRAHLLERLIGRLDADPEVESAWESEADRREAVLTSGTATEVPSHEALARLRTRL